MSARPPTRPAEPPKPEEALLLVGGERVAGAGPPLAVEDPYSQELLAEVGTPDQPQFEAALAAAREARRKWAHTPAAERAALLHEVVLRLEANSERLAHVMTLEGGKPLVENRDELAQAAGTLRYYAELGRHSAGRLAPPPAPSQLSLVVRQPVGVVACITPWNFPLLLLTWKLAPALAAGNTVVCKPSELTPIATLMLGACLEHLPPGVVTLLAGDGGVGERLVADPRVDCVAFTGSIETGKAIAARCVQRLARLNLELGGKDAFIVCADVGDEVETATRAGAWAAFFNAGQVCAGAERFLVAREVEQVFTEQLVARASEVVLGDPLDPATDIGPMISATQRAHVERQLEQAAAAGAQLLTGGQAPARRGYFLDPAVVRMDSLETPLFEDETFGPVAPVAAVADLEEAIRLTNSVRYGLGCTVYTRDISNIVRCIRDLEVGMVWFNDPLTENDASPFGGVKESGMGRELGEEGLAAFQEPKRVHIESEPRVQPWWFPYGG